jgi:putative endonuclease
MSWAPGCWDTPPGGRLGSRYTRGRRPTKLVYHEAQPSRSLALRREAAIKALSRQQKVALIRQAAGRR